MHRTKLIFGKFHQAHFLGLVAAGILLLGCFPPRSLAQRDQKTFSSAEEASNALLAATKNNDEKELLQILGPDGKQIVSSGDETEDANCRTNFVQKYQEMHRLVREPDGTTILYIGAENWPSPIPLMNEGHSWFFDTDAGKKEILYRRVGQNEVSAIQVTQQLVAAEKEYYSAHNNEYAQEMFSDAGRHNGLYWKAADGEPQSPIGPLVAAAVAEGYTKGRDVAPTPYRGYYYLILKRHRTNGSAAAKSYIVNGKMTGGFAFLAYPAEYKSSGVMTFIVNQDGVVYEKDLGMSTSLLAKSLKVYNPTSGWQRADEQQEEMASGRKPD
jgi:hypothetical protein